MTDEKLAIDEAERIARHESVKNNVGAEVQEDIVRGSEVYSESEQAQAAAVGSRMKQKALNDVINTETEVERARSLARVSQIVDYCFYVIYGFIGLEIFLELLGARDSSGFKVFIDTVSAPFLVPFKSLVIEPNFGRIQFKLSYVVALIVYLLLHLAINALLRTFAHRKTSI